MWNFLRFTTLIIKPRHLHKQQKENCVPWNFFHKTESKPRLEIIIYLYCTQSLDCFLVNKENLEREIMNPSVLGKNQVSSVPVMLNQSNHNLKHAIRQEFIMNIKHEYLVLIRKFCINQMAKTSFPSNE